MLNPKISTHYLQLYDIFINENYSNREKLLLIFEVLKNLFHFISENEKSSFTEFARFNFVLVKYNLPKNLKLKSKNFRKLIHQIKKNKTLLLVDEFVAYYLQSVCELIETLTNTEIPTELSKLFIPEEIFFVPNTLQKIDAKENSNINLRCSLLSKNTLNKNTLNKNISETQIDLLCITEEAEKVLVEIPAKLTTMCSMIWKTCVLNITNLIENKSTNQLDNNAINNINTSNILTSNNINNNNENENSEEEIKHYKTTNKTQIIVEPDYLLDVTEIVECFTAKDEYPIIPILNKFLNRLAGSAAFKGNIINSFFDELLDNIEIDFDSALQTALERKPFALLIFQQELENKGVTFKNFNDFLHFFRGEFYDSFNNLRQIIIENYLTQNLFVEPSFISNLFGLQGRLDLMIVHSEPQNEVVNMNNFNNNEVVNIDVVELKSSKAPEKNIRIAIGLHEKRELLLPLWINHYVQIICYNMLLSSAFPTRKGISSVLYSLPNELNPLRNVVDNLFVQNEILTMRNWIVAFMRELALGNLSIIENLEQSQIDFFPKYSHNNTKKLIADFAKLSELERAYLKVQISFITKEIFANKTGLFANNQHSGNRHLGFSSFWLYSLEEKLLKGLAVSNLELNKKDSNFENMHICFTRTKNNAAKQFYTPFRKGDICIIYPNILNDNSNISQENLSQKNLSQENLLVENSNSQEKNPTNNQLLRGRILEIDDKKISVSLRNKLSQHIVNSNNFVNTNYSWVLEADYMEMMNNYLFSSISDFIFGDFENKNCILGLSEPKFINENESKSIENKKQISSIKKAVKKIKDLSAEKTSVIISALLAKNYFLIQGPPGTGKTSFILKYLTQILFENSNENLLLVAYTNRAADEICKNLNKILNPDFSFLRLGNRDSSDFPENLTSNFPIAEIGEKVKNCRIFVSTVTTANATPELFQLKNFDTIIIDEAAQILESHIIGLLSKAKRFIMIGDEKQLPAVTSIAAKELIVQNELLNQIELKNLGDSLFERLLRICKKNEWNAFAMLREQARMQPEIMKLANSLFYKNGLKISRKAKFSTSGQNINFAEQVFSRENIQQAFNKMKTINTLEILKNIDFSKKCIFIDTKLELNLKVNLFETEIVADLIKLFNSIDFHSVNDINVDNINDSASNSSNNHCSIGVISPWRIQCNEILRRLEIQSKENVTVDTVERFQGSERDIIIFSTATNNVYLLDLLSESKWIDEMEIDRKLNVAITRAKQKFILLGSRELLCQKEVYRKLIKFIEKF